MFNWLISLQVISFEITTTRHSLLCIHWRQSSRLLCLNFNSPLKTSNTTFQRKQLISKVLISNHPRSLWTYNMLEYWMNSAGVSKSFFSVQKANNNYIATNGKLLRLWQMRLLPGLQFKILTLPFFKHVTKLMQHTLGFKTPKSLFQQPKANSILRHVGLDNPPNTWFSRLRYHFKTIERLVVMRLFEMSKAGLSSTGMYVCLLIYKFLIVFYLLQATDSETKLRKL